MLYKVVSTPDMAALLTYLLFHVRRIFLSYLILCTTTYVARPTLLLYGSETWVTTKRDMTRLEAAEMRFLRIVKGYTRLDKIRNEVIRK